MAQPNPLLLDVEQVKMFTKQLASYEPFFVTMETSKIKRKLAVLLLNVAE